MLRGLDRGLGWLTWAVAAVLVVMLLIGPAVVANDKAQPGNGGAGAGPYSGGGGTKAGGAKAGGGAPAGKTVFTENCGSCHTLSAAGTSGQVGPQLDGIGLDAQQIAAIVRSGKGGMPSFGAQLSGAQVAAVAAFVASSQ